MIRRIHAVKLLQRYIMPSAKPKILSRAHVDAAHPLNSIANFIGTSIIDNNPAKNVLVLLQTFQKRRDIRKLASMDDNAYRCVTHVSIHGGFVSMSQPPSGDRRWNAASGALNLPPDVEELRFVPSSVGSGGNYSQPAHITIMSFDAKTKRPDHFFDPELCY
jgi:hypothetical protein